jgi:hypothetical protein
MNPNSGEIMFVNMQDYPISPKKIIEIPVWTIIQQYELDNKAQIMSDFEDQKLKLE